MSDDPKPKLASSSFPSPPEDGRTESGYRIGSTAIAIAGNLAALGLPLGTALERVFQTAVKSPLERRRAAWFQNVAEKIREIEERYDVSPERLGQNPLFLDAVFRATEAAMKDGRREKWELLHNALLNSALPSSFDEDIQQMLFRAIDEMTLTDFAILREIANPQVDPKVYEASGLFHEPVLAFLMKRLGRTAADEADLRICLDRLEALGLLPATRTNPTGAAGLRAYIRLTPMCQRLLAFVANPPNPKTG